MGSGILEARPAVAFRFAALVALVGLVLGWLALPPGRAGAQATEQGVPAGRYYPQGGGFAVTNQRGMPFYSGFQRLGGVAQLGFPVTRRFFLDGFTCQGMQGGLVQYLPDSGQVVLANTFELLSRYNQDDWLFARGIPRPIRDDGSSTYAEAVQIRLGWLTNPQLAAAYLAPPAGRTGPWTTDDAIDRYGLPMSRPESFGPFTSQRFQRIAFQLWEQSVPGMPPPGSVTPALGGDLVKQSGFLGPLATTPQGPGEDSAVPVDLTVGVRNQTAQPRRSGPFAYSVPSSASGRSFPLVPLGSAPPSVPPGSTALVALLQVQNTGGQPAATSEQTVRLRDRNGATYQASLPLSAVASQALGPRTPSNPGGVLAPGDPIPAGGSAAVPLAFTVPEGSGPWSLEPGTGEPAPPVRLEEPAAGLTDEPAEDTPVAIDPAQVIPPAPAPVAVPTAIAPQRTSEQVLPNVARLKVSQVVRPFAGPLPAPAGEELVAVRAELENLSANNLPYGVSTLGVRSRGALIRGQPTGAADSFPGGLLAPGQTASGTVAFQVPLGAPITAIIYTVANNTLEVPFP